MSAALFATLSGIRGRRIFHPTGRAYLAEFRATAGELTPDDLAGRRMRAVVRISRGAGLPDSLPDVLGLAVRVLEGSGEDPAQDFVLASSLSRPGLRHLLVPTRWYLGTTYSSVLPYRMGDRQILFGARAVSGSSHARTLDEVDQVVADGGVRFSLLAAELTGAWSRIGTVAVLTRCHQDVSERLRFNPWNTSSDLHPAGPLNRLRRDAYRASQAARLSSASDGASGA